VLMAAMLLIDVLIRYPTVALMLLFAALAIRDGWRASTTRYAALLSISMSALLLEIGRASCRERV